MTTELHYLTIGEASALIESGQLSPVELTRAFLDRIDTLDDTLECYITVLHDGAMAEARQAEAEILRGEYRGPLHGIPIALRRPVRHGGHTHDRKLEGDGQTASRLRTPPPLPVLKAAVRNPAWQARHARVRARRSRPDERIPARAQPVEYRPYPRRL